MKEITLKDKIVFWVIFWLIVIIAFSLKVQIVKAADQSQENQAGVAYGAAVNKDTGYVSWAGKTYLDMYNWKEISIQFKLLTVTSDTVIFRTLGSNQEPDTLQYYNLIRADTVLQSSMGDSMVTIALPYGTDPTTAILPRFLKLELYLYDADAGGAAQATITDGWIVR
jgi:hypothetical protein